MKQTSSLSEIERHDTHIYLCPEASAIGTSRSLSVDKLREMVCSKFGKVYTALDGI
jgi:hypothetical protein